MGTDRVWERWDREEGEDPLLALRLRGERGEREGEGGGEGGGGEG